MLRRRGAVITCLAISVLSLHVSADNLPFNVHDQPCTHWPDQDFDAPCNCFSSCKGTPGALNFDVSFPNGPMNIAYNRPAEMSSSQGFTAGRLTQCPGAKFYPCQVFNARLSTQLSRGCVSTVPVNCILTAPNEHRAWLFVDFQRLYTVSHARYTKRDTPTRLAQITELVDSALCHHWPGYDRNSLRTIARTEAGNITNVVCRNPVRGRYYRLQKRHTTMRDDGNFNLEFCEIMVYACRQGTYGVPGTDNSCRNCQSCSYFCDNYYGCQERVPFSVTNNAAIKRSVAASSQQKNFPANLATDGIAVINREINCWKSSWENTHFIRVTLDGVWVIVAVRITSLEREENSPMKIVTLTTYRLTNAREAHQADEVVCWELDGPLGEQYIRNCSSCTEDLTTCPRGIFLTAVETNVNVMGFCELEVLALPAKEVGAGESCQTGASCGLVFCEGKLACSAQGTCLAQAGSYCQRDEDCSQGECSVSNVCKLPLNSFCGAGFEHLCMEKLVCDTFASQCKYDHDEGKCADDSECFNRFVCDYKSVCRNPLGAVCSSDIDCVAGAVCKDRECQCNTPVSQRNASKCIPTDTCKPPTILGQKFECRVPVGSACVMNGKGVEECTEGAKCVQSGGASTCQASVNARCDPNAAADSNQCDPDKSRCDTTFGRCRVIPGKPCSPSEPCASGYICQDDTDKLCHVRPLEDCTNYPNWCADHYECVVKNGKKVCLLKNWAECNDALPELTCQESVKCLWDFEGVSRCMQDIGQPCSDNLRCRDGARCDTGQCYWMAASPCNNTDECGPGLICDQDKRCRILKNEPCGHSNRTYCQLRALCINNICKCDTSVASDSPNCTQTYDIAKGLVYMVCEKCDTTTNVNCKCANAGMQASCEENSGLNIVVCKCIEGYEHDEHYKCKPSIGSRCEEPVGQTEDNIVCASHATCFEHKCVIMLDQPCFGRSSDCKTGLRCNSDYVCKVDLGFGCNTTDQCFGDYVCDPLAKKCALKVNSSCKRDTDCVAGAFCDETDRCICNTTLTAKDVTKDGRCTPLTGLPAGDCFQGQCLLVETTTCTDGKCVCKSGYALDPSPLSCQLADGTACGLDPNKTCLPESFCDRQQRVCKRQPGFSCVTSTDCITGAICVKSVCRLDIYQDCSDFPSGCITGTSCDAANQCKRLHKSYCNYTEQPDSCGAGALCTDSTCTCDEMYTKDSGFGCLPFAGRVNGRCLLGEQKCSVPGAECPEGSAFCTCKEGFGVDYRTFTCTGVRETKAEEDVSWIVVVATWLGIIVLLIIVLSVLAYIYRLSALHKKDDLLEEFAERRARIVELQDQVHMLEILEMGGKHWRKNVEAGGDDLLDIIESDDDDDTSLQSDQSDDPEGSELEDGEFDDDEEGSSGSGSDDDEEEPAPGVSTRLDEPKVGLSSPNIPSAKSEASASKKPGRSPSSWEWASGAGSPGAPGTSAPKKKKRRRRRKGKRGKKGRRRRRRKRKR